MKNFYNSIIILLLFFLLLGCNSRTENNESKVYLIDSSGKINKEKITITTSDGLKLSANYFYNIKNLKKSEPLIVLIHQFRSDKEQWKKGFIDSLLSLNYKVIAYDIRSHGESDKAKVQIEKLLSDGEQAPKDIVAVYNWAKKQEGIDSTRTAVIGTSIGASLAFYAVYDLSAKVIIGISVGKGPFEAFTGLSEMKMAMVVRKIKNVLLIYGDKDGDYPNDGKYLYNGFLDDPRDIISFDSDKHGKDLIKQFPEINTSILNWLRKYL